MPVMKQLNVGGVTYDTVGEASVTQVVSTGTKIATVSIDGTSTDLYAPSGGSSVEPATDAPIADGTAAVGTSVKYAREDHVHPTDTSRAAASHTHAIADVTSLQTALDGKAASSHTHAASDVASGTLDVARIPTGTTSGTVALGDHTHSGYQPTLVSGTNIKTVNNTSLLGSGNIAIDVPTASTTNPSMDGTASYGSGTSYARANHVHPTDTSRAASTHNHGSITSAGAITSDTAVESGDKLIIADSSASSVLKRSGIAFGSDTTTFLRNDGQWAAAGGGGGGYDLTIDVVVDTSGSLISHNVVAADCIDFVKSFVAGDDVRAVAYMRWHTYDDEDDVYASAGYELRLVEADTSSYGGGQYEADGGWTMIFENVVMTVKGPTWASFTQYRLIVSGINDDPELSPTVTSTRTTVTLS